MRKTLLVCLILTASVFAKEPVKPFLHVTFGVTPTGGHTVGLTCTPGSGGGTPVGFQFSRGTVTGGPYTPIGSLQTTCAYTDSDPTLTEGTTYYYVAQAQNGGGKLSANSNEAPALIPFLPCNPPTNLQTAPH